MIIILSKELYLHQQFSVLMFTVMLL